MWLVTEAGRNAWKSEDTAIPEEYRRLLRNIDLQGDTRAVEELHAQQAAALVQDWLNELEELGFIEAGTRSADADITAPVKFDRPIMKLAAKASAVLSGTGAYLAERPAKAGKPKPPGETTILIVEDDPDQLALADLRVSAAGYAVRAATSVSELRRRLAEGPAPDLLLLDIMLPDGNGFAVLSDLRKDPRFASLPIVMLTVVKEPAYIAEGLALGADGYVTKPYSKNILIGLIKAVLT